MKVRDLLSDKEIPLPIIFDCPEINDFEPKNSVFKNQHVISKYYQTSKLRCKTFFKPLHITKNEK